MSVSLTRAQFEELSPDEKRRVIIEGERKIGKPSSPLSNSSVKTKQEPVDSLISEHAIEIFSYLDAASISVCCSVRKEWNELVKENGIWNSIVLRDVAFGKKQWTKYLGDVGQEPPLPEDISKILSSVCPFFPKHRVVRTHMLVLIPKKVNKISLSLIGLKALVKNPKEGDRKSSYNFLHPQVDSHLSEQSDESYWVLMTKNLLEESKLDSPEQQLARVAALSKKTPDYRCPTALEAATCIFTKYIATGEVLFKGYTFTRCLEETDSCPVVVGNFAGQAGLIVSESWDHDVKGGIAPLRKL